MNLHPYFALLLTLVSAISFLLVAYGIRVLAQALDHIGDYQNGRMFRRLSRAAARRAAQSDVDEAFEDEHRALLINGQEGDPR